jgi:phosphoglycolate phosphatase-like HAD superfamily hydrolase
VRTLVLFDIDGTLLSAAGAGRRAIYTALREVFGGVGPEDYWFDGRTDPEIVRDLMRLDGHDDALIESRLPAVLSRYTDRLSVELADPDYRPSLCPGVLPLLETLDARDDVVVGLLTGNIEPGAAAKLRAVGLDPARFTIGAFGSDHAIRGELPAIAVARARDQLGLDVPGEQVVVIGDTPADVACGSGIGARAIAVATGRYTVAELAACNPSVVFADLSDTTAVVNAVVASIAGA